ncbi:hypothetical protein EVAR_84188_1 [Eumeta japonica]|uniref:Uncharacterized protein n=1 Tax=Eumeta variegata TaxID=151549 RepID=A0A4C1SA37_EUMVA|nr:hypothetical protein EVAR_84188_1 [Eumeta japonica]
MRRPRQMGRYSADKGRVLLAAGASAAQNRTHMADGLSVEVRLTTHLCGSFNPTCSGASSLRRSCWLERAGAIAVALVQEPYVGNTGELKRYSGCRVIQRVAPRAGPVKAAILILDSDVDVEEDQTLIDENVTAAVVTAGTAELASCRSTRVRQADRPIPRPREVGLLEARDEQNHPGGDVNAWSVVGQGPSLAKYGGRECSPLYWIERRNEVVRGVTSSDHNAVTFNVRTGGGRKALTAGTVEVVDSCDRLDEVVDLYTECVKHACDTAIPRKRSMRRPKPLVESRTRGAEKGCEPKSVASETQPQQTPWSRNM